MNTRTILAALLLLGCGERDPMVGSLSENVGAAFAPCSPAEIRFLARKHNFMTAFEPCGNNPFEAFAWSPDGRQLYFQMVLGGHVMDAESPQKETRPVPTPTPVGPAAWLSTHVLAVPIGPTEEGAVDEQLALFDMDVPSVFTHPLPGLRGVRDTHRGDAPHQVLFTALGPDGVRGVYELDTHDGALKRPFPWLTGAVERFDYTPAMRVATVGAGGTVSIYDATDGSVQGRWSEAQAGTLHPGGRFLMLEHEGDETSVFAQRSWDELSDRAREREQARVEKFQERLPEHLHTTVRPPTLSVVDVATGRRFRLTSVQGHGFEWYEPTDYYGSFLLWGFEGKQFKRNVLLGNFADRLRSFDKERTMMGVEPYPRETYTAPPKAAQ